MLSLSKRFIFIHTPKTGGNSLQTLLLPFAEETMVNQHQNREDGPDRFELKNEQLNLRKHATLDAYLRAMDPEVFWSFYKFSVIRNPWDQMISYYFSPHRGRTDWNRDEFKRLVNQTPVLRHYVHPNRFQDKLRTRMAALSGRPGKTLDRYVHLIRFEHLKDDFAAVCQRLELEVGELPHRNASPRKAYWEYYDDELVDLVAQRFREEIDYGGYTFESGPAI